MKDVVECLIRVTQPGVITVAVIGAVVTVRIVGIWIWIRLGLRYPNRIENRSFRVDHLGDTYSELYTETSTVRCEERTRSCWGEYPSQQEKEQVH